jgi:magnesium-protoporphyrin O-methyltransferase
VDEPAKDVPYCCFDDWASDNAARARKGRTASIVRAMLAQLDAAGLEGRSLLDVGCGAGDLALAALERGAIRITGIDLGTGAIANARALADERGLADRARFEVGDGSTASLPPADVVVLNRVVCCYRDAAALVDNAVSAAGSVLALSAPASRGAVGRLNRGLVVLGNGWYALRASKFGGFRTFVHDLGAIDERVRAAGFALRFHGRHRLAWDVAVYERPEASAR